VNTAGTIIADKDTLCAWETAQFVLLGSSGSPIRWQSSFSSSNNYNDIPGADDDTVNAPITIQSTYYRAIVGSGVCADTTGTILIVVPASPVAAFTGIVSHNEVTFNSGGSQGASFFHWDFGDGSTDDAPNPVHTYADSATYVVCLTVINSSNCADTLCANIIAGEPVGIGDLPGAGVFDIYPNPASQVVQIVATNPGKQPEAVGIYDAVGKRVLYVEPKGNFIDVSTLANGIYMVEIRTSKELKPEVVKLEVIR
jgi:PKD repeat protein